MKPTRRKLILHAQTLRNLSPGEFGRVASGMTSKTPTMCSTEEDTNCVDTGTCPTLNGSCVTGCCDPHTRNCSNFC